MNHIVSHDSAATRLIGTRRRRESLRRKAGTPLSGGTVRTRAASGEGQLGRGVETNLGDRGLELGTGVAESGDPDEHIASGLVGAHRNLGVAVG